MASYDVFMNDPKPLWEMTKDVNDLINTVAFNPGHKALARIEIEGGKEMAIITQNVDSLHSKAGSSLVYEVYSFSLSPFLFLSLLVFFFRDLILFFSAPRTRKKRFLC